MNMKVFLLNKSKHLEISSQRTFFESFQDGKSYYWIDVEEPEPASLKDFLKPLGLHSIILEECLESVGTSRVDLFVQSLFIKFSVQLTWDTLEQPFLEIFNIFPGPYLLDDRDCRNTFRHCSSPGVFRHRCFNAFDQCSSRLPAEDV